MTRKLNEGNDTIHYELGPGKVLCMQTDPTVTRDRFRVTCKRCLRKLKKGIRQRDLSGGVKTQVRHLLKPKAVKEASLREDFRQRLGNVIQKNALERRANVSFLKNPLLDKYKEISDKADVSNSAQMHVDAAQMAEKLRRFTKSEVMWSFMNVEVSRHASVANEIRRNVELRSEGMTLKEVREIVFSALNEFVSIKSD